MRSIIRSVSAACAATLLTAAAARAQQPTRIELGIDAALTHVSYDPDPGESFGNTTFSFPLPAIRAGFQVTPLVSIEPTLGIQAASGDLSVSRLTFDVGVPINLSGPLNLTATQYFLRPLIGFRHVAFSGEDGTTQTAFGVGIGMRIPMTGRFAWRLEARYAHGLKGDLPSTNEIGLLAGVSLFTR